MYVLIVSIVSLFYVCSSCTILTIIIIIIIIIIYACLFTRSEEDTVVLNLTKESGGDHETIAMFASALSSELAYVQRCQSTRLMVPV